MTNTVSTSLPWTSFLPEDERTELLTAITSTSAACVELDNFEPLARLIDGWRATAEIHGHPDLAKALSR